MSVKMNREIRIMVSNTLSLEKQQRSLQNETYPDSLFFHIHVTTISKCARRMRKQKDRYVFDIRRVISLELSIQ
jgi:hypothetical protein